MRYGTYLKIAAVPSIFALLLAGAAGKANAAPVNYGLNFVTDYNQTDPIAASITADYAEFSVSTDMNDTVGTASVSYPGGSMGLPYGFGYLLDNSVNVMPSNVNTLVPFGTYDFSASGGTIGTVSGSMQYTSDMSISAPAFSSGTYTAAQSINSSKPFQFTFNKLALNSGAHQTVQLTITNLATNTVYTSFLGASSNSLTLPANILKAGSTYTATLIYGNNFSNTPSAGVTNNVQFTSQDSMLITTAATPEASTAAGVGAMFILAAGAAAIRRKRSVVKES